MPDCCSRCWAASWLQLDEVWQLMMHTITRAIFPDDRRGLFAHELRVRPSPRIGVVLLIVSALLGSPSILHAATATWNANPESDIAGYILSYGTQPGVHPTSVDVKNVTTWQLTTLTPGQTYYFVLQAYNTSAMTSVNSAEVVFTALASPPSLTSLTPSSGTVGVAVTIAGTNFGAAGTVTFNGTAAAATSWTATSIGVKVPAGATTGPVEVTVGGQASAGVTFMVTAPPAITFVQANYADPQSSQTVVAVPYLAAQTRGNLNLVVVAWNDSTAQAKYVADA